MIVLRRGGLEVLRERGRSRKEGLLLGPGIRSSLRSPKAELIARGDPGSC